MEPPIAVRGNTIQEIYVERGLLNTLFTDKTPTDLFRFFETANSSDPNLLMYPVLERYLLPNQKYRGPDVDRRIIGGEAYIFPKFKMGLSLADGPRKFNRSGEYWVVPGGTTIPSGLAISVDTKNEIDGYTHHTVHPCFVMVELHFLFLLRRFGSHAIRMNDWKRLYPSQAKEKNYP